MSEPALAPSSAPPAFPPPDPNEQFAGGRTNKLLVLLAVVSLAAAVVMTLLWSGARNQSDGAVADPVSETSQGAGAVPVDPRVVELEAQLAAADEAVRTADAEVAQLRTDLATAEAAREEVASGTDELAAIQAENDTLSSALADTEAQVTGLEAEIADVQAALDAATAAAAEGADRLDPAQTPEFARWVGELLSSRTGSSRLGQQASTCFGAEVIALIGVDAVGAGQHNAASGAARQVVIDAMNAAAATCGIDPGLIYG